MIPMHEYYKYLLPSEARNIYDLILAGIGSLASEGFLDIKGKFNRQSMNNAVDAYLAVRDDHPEYFFLDNKVESTISPSGALVIRHEKRFSPGQIKRINNLLRREIRTILEIPGNLGVVYKEDVIYRRIIRKYKYADGEYAHDISGLLIYGEGVCESLSGMLVIALREAGIPAMKVHGTARGERHCWTKIRMFGQIYYQDITWDLTAGDSSGTNRFFNLSESEMYLDHREDPSQSVRKKYQYYQ